MKQSKKVSIITPCYNGEEFLTRFFENILEQTYKNIELIFINDGSNDKTEEIAKSYIKIFEKNSMTLIYIYQKNAGQAAAMNQGLPIFSGDYLMWTDADDLLDKRNLELKVAYLESHPECGIVMCRGKKVLEKDLTKKVAEYYRIPPKGEDNFFEDLLISKNVIFTPGIYMVRRENVLKGLPERRILESRIGQNFQMLIPIAYISKCGYIHEDLFSYVIRGESHSNTIKTIDDVLKRDRNHEKVVLQLIEDVNPNNKSYYIDIVKAKYMRTQLDTAYFYHDKKLLMKKYKQMKKAGCLTTRDKLIYLSGRCIFVNVCYQMFRKLKDLRYRLLILGGKV